MDLLLLGMIVAFFGGLVAWIGLQAKAAFMLFAGIIVSLYVYLLAIRVAAFDGYCYAFVSDRWRCTRFEHFVHEAGDTLFLDSPLMWTYLFIYAFFYGLLHWLLNKRAKK